MYEWLNTKLCLNLVNSNTVEIPQSYAKPPLCDFIFLPQDYPEEEILIVYDADFKFGQNFFVATTPEAKYKLLHVSTM